MNEFTKEELEILYLSLTGNRNYKGEQMFPSLNSKIQSMIDNYCDHTLRISIDMVQGVNVECPECKKVFA
ncbi:MAG TPA: hypothetical protein VNU45_17990 [Rummeliibacillus sp.]|nr:hypothetical protein [Rummeliibacillus sp.]